MISFSTIYPKVYSDWDRQESFNTQIVDHTVILKDAINAISSSQLPIQTGNAGKALITDGTSVSWSDPFDKLLLTDQGLLIFDDNLYIMRNY